MIYFSIHFIKYLFYSSLFFFDASKDYIGHWTLGGVLYYPIAYFKFMKLMIGEYEPFVDETERILKGDMTNE